jgi:hypothetical protein
VTTEAAELQLEAKGVVLSAIRKAGPDMFLRHANADLLSLLDDSSHRSLLAVPRAAGEGFLPSFNDEWRPSSIAEYVSMAEQGDPLNCEAAALAVVFASSLLGLEHPDMDRYLRRLRRHIDSSSGRTVRIVCMHV